jgi:putative hemolysin
MDIGPSSILLIFIFLFFLILLNAFFSASEMAIVSLNKNKITHLASEGNEKAKLLLKLLREPSKLLATIQIGITLAGFLASASAATTISAPLAKLLGKISIPASNEIALLIVTVILAYITLVFGELFPKRVALQNSESIAMFSVKPILFVSTIALPFIKVLTCSTNMLVKIFGIKTDNLEEKISEEEIRMMINVGEENGVINETEKDMIDGIFEFDNTLAKEIMTPRTNVFALDINTPIEELIDKVIEEQYSRIPVYEDEIDDIIGVLYMKDMLSGIRKCNLTQDSIKSLLRQPYFVPETKNIDALFKELQSSNNYMALLIDEYGGFSGIVTMEDLIEEVMGNIFDEYDENNIYIKKIDTNTYLVNGLASIDEINDALDMTLPTDNADTISGFVIDILGAIPKEDEEHTIEYENIVFKIEKIVEKRIEQLKIYIT